VNFQRPLRRTEDGIETLDHELDLWSRDGREWRWKDEALLRKRVAQGWFAASEAQVRGARPRSGPGSGGWPKTHP
jgi:hypothetical protein